MHWAINTDHIEAARYLISKGANLNARNIDGRTPLYVAVSAKKVNPEIVKLLLEHRANPNIKDNRGVSVTELAKRYGRKRALVKFIFNHTR